MKKVVFLLMMITVLLSSCGEYNKILKSTDYELKYSYAKKYFNAKQYSKSATLLDELVPIFKGTANAEESLYLLAQSYYGQKDYQTASQYFNTYYTTYPKGEFTELARYYSGYGLYLDSPDPAWIRRKRMKPLTSCNYIWSIIRKANVLKKLRTLCSNCRKSSPIRNC